MPTKKESDELKKVWETGEADTAALEEQLRTNLAASSQDEDTAAVATETEVKDNETGTKPEAAVTAQPEAEQSSGTPTGTESDPPNSETQNTNDASTTTDTESPLEKRLKLLELQNERIQAEAEKWRYLAGRRAGAAGFEKNRQGADEAPADLKDIVDSVSGRGGDATAASTYKGDDRIEAALEDASIRAFGDAVITFTSEHPDLPDMLDIVNPIVDRKRADYVEELSSGNPRTIRKATQMLLREAYLEAKEARQKAEVEAATKRQADYVAGVQAKKTQAGISPTNAPAATQARAGSKSLDNASVDELVAQYEANQKAGRA